MIRIFASWQDRVIIHEDDQHHLLNVLRVQVGEKIELLIDQKVYLGIIHSTKPLSISRLKHIETNPELPFTISLLYPVSKGDKFDWVVQKSTELGVDELIPCSSERSVVKWQKDDLDKKFARYGKMIREATLQSKRLRLMKMHRYLPLSQAIELSFDQKFIADEVVRDHSMPSFQLQSGQHIAILVGPEGGFTDEELHLAKAQGYQSISLGPTILRTETAVIVALSLIRQRGLHTHG